VRNYGQGTWGCNCCECLRAARRRKKRARREGKVDLQKLNGERLERELDAKNGTNEGE
jgi:hypothetical protein